MNYAKYACFVMIGTDRNENKFSAFAGNFYITSDGAGGESWQEESIQSVYI
jgi:hypothetical protein